MARGWIKDRFFRAASLDLTVGAEAANAIPVTLQVVDQEGSALAGALEYLVEVRDADMLLELVGAYTLAETGAGAEVSTTARPSLLITTSDAGAAQVTITDVSTTSTDTLHLLFIPVSHRGPTGRATVTFA